MNPLPFSRIEFNRLKKKYATGSTRLQDYHYSFLSHFYRDTGISLQGKTVLEIGGSCFPRELLFDRFDVNQWVSVEKLDWWNRDLPDKNISEKNNHITSAKIFPLNSNVAQNLDQYDHLLFDGCAELIPSDLENRFDIALSCCAFEHIADVGLVLSKIFSALNPGGVMYSSFGPIWSGPLGHHFWIDEQLNFTKKFNVSHFPPYAHLLMNESEMRAYLSHYHSQQIVDKICYDVYHWDGINRMFCEDYERLMKLSPFKNYKYFYHLVPLSKSIRKKLEHQYPDYKNFQFTSMTIIGKKHA
jgi:SAM-dependent methyltransferase